MPLFFFRSLNSHSPGIFLIILRTCILQLKTKRIHHARHHPRQKPIRSRQRHRRAVTLLVLMNYPLFCRSGHSDLTWPLAMNCRGVWTILLLIRVGFNTLLNSFSASDRCFERLSQSCSIKLYNNIVTWVIRAINETNLLDLVFNTEQLVSSFLVPCSHVEDSFCTLRHQIIQDIESCRITDLLLSFIEITFVKIIELPISMIWIFCPQPGIQL